MAPDNQLVEVDRLLCAEPVQPEVVEDQQVGGEEASMRDGVRPEVEGRCRMI